jgi:hypothetical protein
LAHVDRAGWNLQTRTGAEDIGDDFGDLLGVYIAVVVQ